MQTVRGTASQSIWTREWMSGWKGKTKIFIYLMPFPKDLLKNTEWQTLPKTDTVLWKPGKEISARPGIRMINDQVFLSPEERYAFWWLDLFRIHLNGGEKINTQVFWLRTAERKSRKKFAFSSDIPGNSNVILFIDHTLKNILVNMNKVWCVSLSSSKDILKS